jgi:hypothetical protein
MSGFFKFLVAVGAFEWELFAVLSHVVNQGVLVAVGFRADFTLVDSVLKEGWRKI